MFYGVLSSFFCLLALVFLFLGLRTLFKGTWFWGWVRGMSAALLVATSILLALIAWDMRSYRALLEDSPLITVAFEQVGEQAFVATMTSVDGGEVKEFYLRGDQWQIDARVVRWKGIARSLKPGYRLDRISGRYFSLEDERSLERTVYSLFEQEYGVDFWAVAHQSKAGLPLFEAAYGSAAFLPMADAAIFEVALSSSGLVAKPLNNAAQKAVQLWLN